MFDRSHFKVNHVMCAIKYGPNEGELKMIQNILSCVVLGTVSLVISDLVSTQSGGFNALAVFYAAILLLSAIALVPTTRKGR